MSGNDRGRDMTQRVTDSAAKRGLSNADRETIVSALTLVMDLRADALADDHHPAFLHPGRTALVLLDDADVREGTLIAAGCALDSEHRELRVQPELLPENVREIVATIPVPDGSGDELFELLLSADRSVQLVALAERLDYARHLHLTPAGEWRRFHELAREVYLPVAARAHPLLERRFGWWCGMFERRFLALAHGP
jgi:(p)ppGpp synthase/HD superfamily hydrolase